MGSATPSVGTASAISCHHHHRKDNYELCHLIRNCGSFSPCQPPSNVTQSKSELTPLAPRVKEERDNEELVISLH
jgi:hypothetical protein